MATQTGMDLTEILAAMMLDLKMTLDTDITTAEATRCVSRAVDDMSRHMPRERIYEHTWVKDVTDDDFTTPSAADPDYIVDAEDISGFSDGDTCTIAAMWPDVPRPVTVTLTDADNSITSITIVVKGIDRLGVNREERFYRYNGKSQTGKVYFTEVSEVKVSEITGGGAGDILDVGVGDPDVAGIEAWIELSNPVEYNTETIYSAAGKTGTKYTRDTDYEMDYSNGRVRLKNGGSMAAGTTYYANYDRNAVRIDISGILNDLTRIVKVLYPVGNIPEQEVAWGIWDDMLVIGSQITGESQKAMANKEHIMVMYESKHTPPTLNGSGSYPGYLDQVMLIGAEGYACMIHALKHELQASTDLTSLRTELGLTTAVHTLIATALAKVATYCETNGTTDCAVDVLANITDDVAELRTKINTAFDAVNSVLDGVDLSSVATYLGNADTALTAAAAAMVNIVKYLDNNSNADAAGLLTQITTDIASLRTAVNTALDAANAELDAGDFSDISTHLTSAATALAKVTVYLTNNSNEDSKYWLTKITTDIASLRTAIDTALDAANTYLDEIDTTDLGQATVGAEGYLETGDDTINQLNDGGEQVPDKYATYSNARVSIAGVRAQAALGFIQESANRMGNLRSYIEQAGAWGKIATGFVEEANAEIQMANQIANRESVISSQAAIYIQEAIARITNLRSYIEESNGWVIIANAFRDEAAQHIADAEACITKAAQIINREAIVIQQAAGYIAEATGRMDHIRTYIEESGAWVAISNAFLGEGTIRIEEIKTHLDEASKFKESAESEMLLADRYRAEGQSRLAEFQSLLKDRAEYRKRTVDIPVRQPM